MNDCFRIGGIDSRTIGEYGLRIVRLSGNSDDMIIFGGQSVTWEKSLNQDHYEFIKTKKNNIRFTLVLCLLHDEFTPLMNMRIGELFAKSKPLEFYVGEDMDKMLYVVPTSEIVINRESFNMQGTFSITFEATTPYWLTPVQYTDLYLEKDQIFTIDNVSNVHNEYGNYNVYPYVKITLPATFAALTQDGGIVRTESNQYVLTEQSFSTLTEDYQSAFSSNGKNINFQITHISDNNRVISFNGLEASETIEFHDVYEFQSSKDKNIFKIWNKEPFILHEKLNSFKVNFPCRFESRIQYPIVR